MSAVPRPRKRSETTLHLAPLRHHPFLVLGKRLQFYQAVNGRVTGSGRYPRQNLRGGRGAAIESRLIGRRGLYESQGHDKRPAKSTHERQERGSRRQTAKCAACESVFAGTSRIMFGHWYLRLLNLLDEPT